jgi:triosephosphate isomerase
VTKIVAGNWKMHHGPERAREFFESFEPDLPGEGGPRVLVFPPTISLEAVVESGDRDRSVGVGVQNVHHEDSGAFTGETSASMAKEAGASHALIGHSERRHVFGESDDDVRRKVEAVLRNGLVPVVCVGETLEERRAGRLEEVILRQLDAALDALGSTTSEFVIAYEPVWAIGTGETATPEDASQAHSVLKGRLAERLPPERASEVPVLYGGSVKPGNALDLMEAPDVDGVLVGGASLDPDQFARICEAGAAARSGVDTKRGGG